MNRRYTLHKGLFYTLLAVVAFSPIGAMGQIITTLAGDGSRGSAGDDGYAAFATLNSPGGLKADNKGNLYVADQYNNKIRKIDAYGRITTIAGYGAGGASGDGGPAIKAKVSFPVGLTFDKIGNLYFADSRNNRIRKIDTAGIITTVVGTGIPAFSGDDSSALTASLNNPKGVAFDQAGNMYIADCNNNRVRKVDATTGKISTFAGTGQQRYLGENGPATKAALYGPCDVAVDADGNIIIADSYNNAIRKVNKDGIITLLAGTGGLAGYGGDNGLAGVSRLGEPISLAIGRDGTIFFADHMNNRVRKIDTKGQINNVAGDGTAGNAFNGDGGLAVDATIDKPTAVAVDSSGNLYIAEQAHRVRYVYLATPVVTDKITVFPNPCHKNTTIFLPSQYEEIATVFVMTEEGRVISQSIGPTNRYIDLGFDVPGNYHVYVVSKRGKWTGRITSLPY